MCHASTVCKIGLWRGRVRPPKAKCHSTVCWPPVGGPPDPSPPLSDLSTLRTQLFQNWNRPTSSVSCNVFFKSCTEYSPYTLRRFTTGPLFGDGVNGVLHSPRLHCRVRRAVWLNHGYQCNMHPKAPPSTKASSLIISKKYLINYWFIN